jgi:hypothetical protein
LGETRVRESGRDVAGFVLAERRDNLTLDLKVVVEV